MLNNATVPVASGKVIVLSVVGSVTVIPVSKSFAVDPSKDIVPLDICIEFAASVVPERNAVVAIKLEEVKVFNPAIVDSLAPSATLVLPIVRDELANPLLGIEDALVNIVPVAFGTVRVLSPPVASAAVSIISFVSAVDPSNVMFPLAIDIALGVAATTETSVVEDKEESPAIVDTVAQSAIAVLPIVTSSFAS